MPKQKTFYYTSFNEEVEPQTIDEIIIDENYNYTTNCFWGKAVEFIYYYIIMKPIAFLICRAKKVKWVNKKLLRQIKNKGCFIYGNHTNNITDTFAPTIMSHKKPFFIVNSKNLNVPFFKKSTKMLGAIPLAHTWSAQKNFLKTLSEKVNKHHPIIVYPEAKIWPCYTGIRPFKSTCFRYPVKYNVPCYSMTTTYQKTKRDKCKIVVYIDGPFFANSGLSEKENEIMLYNKVFASLTQHSNHSNFETHKYIKIGENNDKYFI